MDGRKSANHSILNLEEKLPTSISTIFMDNATTKISQPWQPHLYRHFCRHQKKRKASTCRNHSTHHGLTGSRVKSSKTSYQLSKAHLLTLKATRCHLASSADPSSDSSMIQRFASNSIFLIPTSKNGISALIVDQRSHSNTNWRIQDLNGSTSV